MQIWKENIPYEKKVIVANLWSETMYPLYCTPEEREFAYYMQGFRNGAKIKRSIENVDK